MSALTGRTILIVEDEFTIAMELADALAAQGALIAGPVARVSEALALLADGKAIDGAVLDINLRGEKAWPIAAALAARAIPFVFATGYDELAETGGFAAAARLEKPVDPSALGGLLFAA